MNLTLRPEAESDIEDAARWYEEQYHGLGGEFLDEIIHTLEILTGNPDLYPRVHGILHRAIVRRFPFGIFYHVDSEGIIIVAVMHASWNPKEWKNMRNINSRKILMRKWTEVQTNKLNRSFIADWESKFYNAFQDFFENRSEFDNLLMALGTDRIKIIRLGFFYYVVSKEIKHSGITLICIFSIMEASSREKFLHFEQWLVSKIKNSEDISYPINNKDELKKLALSFQKEYYDQHGSSEKVRQFIGQYFAPEDKQKLVNGFRVRENDMDFAALDFDKKVKAIIETLYNERSSFVHQAQLPQIFGNNREFQVPLKLGAKKPLST